MELGCHLPNQGPLATRDALATFARAADERGVASLWVSDHVIFPRTATGNYPGGRFPHRPDKPYLEPVIALTAAAMCTTRARLGASVFILGHRHPVVMRRRTRGRMVSCHILRSWTTQFLGSLRSRSQRSWASSPW
jgi:alkanesulfonate monooxygenase SsuD/methylene tetrahydromethanopterin reductase-like flavin-dependent oxidoreductase (luciferase family)